LKTKLLTMFALVLCIGAFLLPVSAYAAAEADPPTVKAWLSEDILFIEAADSGTGVEAVFINDERVNYRVDGGLALFASDYGDEGETISVYAMDFAGNKSETVTVQIPKTATTPEPTTQSNPFTPAGQASVVDEATESDGKDFYTFTTPAGNIFYLIIDHQRESENVYFLNAVTENDLLALAESSGSSSGSAIPTPDPVPQPDPEPTPDPEPAPPEKESGNGTMIFLVIAIIALGGAGYYIKIVRPKQQAAASGDGDDDFEDGDDDEEMEFEDEPEDDGDFPEDEDSDPEAEDE